jgi:hypothetical protein
MKFPAHHNLHFCAEQFGKFARRAFILTPHRSTRFKSRRNTAQLNTRMAGATDSRIQRVAETLENYAQRGVFRGFGRGPVRQGKASFKMLWHRDQTFELIFDTQKNTLRFPLVLPNVPANFAMYQELKQFIAAQHADELPEHRRIDRTLTQIQPSNRGGKVALTAQFTAGNDAYATRKLIHLVHEIFLTFLYDGKYFEYLVETFELDPDKM